MISEGLAAASQEAIARRANVTQSAVRHYFPTKDELLIAFFSTSIERVQQQLHNVMAEKGQDPRAQLLESASLHYDRVLKEEDAYFFEAAVGNGLDGCQSRSAVGTRFDDAQRRAAVAASRVAIVAFFPRIRRAVTAGP